MVEELFRQDAYLKEAEATVTALEERGVRLDRSIFYPTGGGQPGDTGTLRWDGGEARVVDAVKAGGAVLHIMEPGSTVPTPGTTVTAEIDWTRRHTLMRTHTALHALSGIVFTDYGAKVTGGNMQPGVARMDFELDVIIQEFGREVEANLNVALRQDHAVHVSFMPRAEALADPDL